MAQQAPFGRRGLGSSPPARTSVQPEISNPDLEAFAASVRNDGTSDIAEFARWRRDRRPRRLLMIGVGLVLLAPGMICFALQAPLWVSLSLELFGFVANGWLRRERRRQASAIAVWTPDR